MIKHATIKDLAQALGISKSTVSRALADHSDVKPETKRLVLEMAEKMNYRPNPYAQNLIRRRSKVIGVVVPEFVNSFFPRIIIQIQKVFEKEGFNVLITQSGESAEIELKNLHLLENSMVEGIILSVTEKGRNDEYYRRLIDNGIPIVFFNRPSNEVEASKVVIDDFRMAFFAVEHVLYANGTKRTRPLHLMGPKGIFNSATRHQGYKQALSKHGIDPAPDTFVQCRDISRECGFETMNAILDGDRIPDAVFCFNDQLAIGALKAIKKRGYRIPEQIAVMGFSESQSALLTEPQLSSVAQPLDLIGYMLKRIIQQFTARRQALPKGAVEQAVIAVHLVVIGGVLAPELFRLGGVEACRVVEHELLHLRHLQNAVVVAVIRLVPRHCAALFHGSGQRLDLYNAVNNFIHQACQNTLMHAGKNLGVQQGIGRQLGKALWQAQGGFGLAGQVVEGALVLSVQPLGDKIIAIRLMRGGDILPQPVQVRRGQRARCGGQQNMVCQLLHSGLGGIVAGELAAPLPERGVRAVFR